MATFAQYLRLDLTVWDSNLTAIKAARKMIAKQHQTSREMREARHAFYRDILAYHENSINEFVKIQTAAF